MADESANKRIAKNTIFLYFRSLLIMAISLFSSRIILQVLGVDDYGLYGAIGSIVMMFSIINNTLAVGTSRFLTFELGRNDNGRLKKTFSAAFAMHVAMALFLLILLESIGLWFANYKMQIPEGREFAANVIFQLSIVSCMFSLTQVPYSALIIAHEKMSVYAYVGIVEAVFKLALIFVLLYIPFKDNLIAYGIILAAWSIGLQIFYRFYCRKHFAESKLGICRDKSVYKGMLTYSLWDFVGQFCATGNGHGLNVLINMFFGVTVNAGRVVAYQVENAISTFTQNFLTAVNPQIVKSYAAGDVERFKFLINESSRLSFYLLFVVSLPVFLEAPYILSIWLIEVPETSVYFLRFALYYSVFRICTRSFVLGIHATGDVKYLNLTSGCYSAGTFLLAIYIAYKLGAPYWACMVVQGFNGIILTYLEFNSLRRKVPFSIKRTFWGNVLKPWFTALICCIIPGLELYYLEESFTRLLIVAATVFTSAPLIIYANGLKKNEKEYVKSILKEKVLGRLKK